MASISICFIQYASWWNLSGSRSGGRSLRSCTERLQSVPCPMWNFCLFFVFFKYIMFRKKFLPCNRSQLSLIISQHKCPIASIRQQCFNTIHMNKLFFEEGHIKWNIKGCDKESWSCYINVCFPCFVHPRVITITRPLCAPSPPSTHGSQNLSIDVQSERRF